MYMIKNVHLGFFINEYNKEPIYTDLIEFKDINELDQFMDYFYNNNEKIKKYFEQDISEYSIDNIDQFQGMGIGYYRIELFDEKDKEIDSILRRVM